MLKFKNILVVRTDRMGDVILTTPSIAALKENFPQARVSMLIAPSTYEIIEGNPHLDEIIVDDRQGVHRGFWGFCRLVKELRQRKFDLAIVYHTKKRTNLTCFAAGIPERIGYHNNKFGFLLTMKIPDQRPQGLKHEVQYCLDLLRAIGIERESKKLFMEVKKEWNHWAQQFLLQHGVNPGERLIAIHPGASCISKRWMPERFAQVADYLIVQYRSKVVLIGSAENKMIVAKILGSLKGEVVDATAQTSVGQLAALLKRCQLLVSNDSGPVHLAVAVGVPVISIFGRNQKGLSPIRWGPLGPNDRILHKEVGCPVCLAHNCQIEFKCLDEIKTGEVLEAVDSLARLW